MRQRSGSSLAFALALFGVVVLARADETVPATAQSAEPSTTSISREVKEIYEKSGKAVVKIRGTDQHGDLCGTGFFIDPAGTLYTAFSVGGDTGNLTVEFVGRTCPSRVRRDCVCSGVASRKEEV